MKQGEFDSITLWRIPASARDVDNNWISFHLIAFESENEKEFSHILMHPKDMYGYLIKTKQNK